jgi:hypothetical protein
MLRSCSLHATLERARAGRGSPDPAQEPALGAGLLTWLFYTSRSLALVILGGAARIAVSDVDTRKEDWSKE